MTGIVLVEGRRLRDRFLAECAVLATNLLKDEKGKWSTSRLLLWLNTGYGWRLGEVEVSVVYAHMRGALGATYLPNTLWAAWSSVEMMLAVAVFGPRVAEYVKGWFNGGAAATATAVRDTLATPEQRRAVAVTVDAGGTEYTP